MAVCDGCGAQVDDAHIRGRIERLELATRFRPIHISVLLIDAAPPEREADYFYRTAGGAAVRSPAAREYFDALMAGAGVDRRSHGSEESALAEFQRHGFFLIGAIECAPPAQVDVRTLVRAASPTLLRRVQVSYKPKSIALLSLLTQPLVALFEQSPWGERMVLDGGIPFADPARDGLLAKALAARARV
jgi:hypothetical protein